MAIYYLGAAINTMAGWLYVISGVCLALLGVSVFLAPRSLKNLVVKRAPIPLVTVGDELSIEIEIYNPTQKPVILLQVTDILPFILAKPINNPIDTNEAKNSYRWQY